VHGERRRGRRRPPSRDVEADVEGPGLAVDRSRLFQLAPHVVGGDDFCANPIGEGVGEGGLPGPRCAADQGKPNGPSVEVFERQREVT